MKFQNVSYRVFYDKRSITLMSPLYVPDEKQEELIG